MRDESREFKVLPIVVLSILWASSLVFYGHQYIFRVLPGSLWQFWHDEFGFDALYMSTAVSSFWYTYLFMQMFTGLLVARYCKIRLFATTVAFHAVAILILSFSDNLFHVIAAEVMLGASSSLALVLCLNWGRQLSTPKHFPLISGVCFAIGGLGAVAGGLPIRLLLDLTGWRIAIRWLISVNIILLIITGIISWKYKSMEQMKTGMPWRECLQQLRLLGSKWSTVRINLYLIFHFLPMIALVSVWLQGYLVLLYGHEDIYTKTATSAVIAGYAVGSPMLGYWASRLQWMRQYLLATGSCIGLILSLVILYLQVAEQLEMVLLFGLGCVLAFTVIAVAETAKLTTEKQFPLAVGLNMFSINAGGATGLLLVGWVMKAEKISSTATTLQADQVALALIPISFAIATVIALCKAKTTPLNTGHNAD